MLDLKQFEDMVVGPALAEIGLDGAAARAIVLGTALQESGLRYLRQIGPGPALGPFQMEPATHDDIWSNFLAYREPLADAVKGMRVPGRGAGQMAWNLLYAAAMCRVHYYRVPARLPDPADADAMGAYWKNYYNTGLGSGTAAEFTAKYRAAGLDKDR